MYTATFGGLFGGPDPAVCQWRNAVVVQEAVQHKVSRQQPEQDPVDVEKHETKGEASVAHLPPHFVQSQTQTRIH